MKTRLSEEVRACRREADRQRSIEAVQALQTSDGWKAWLASRRHFHRYSLANQCLIAMQCPHVTYVAGFRAWLRLGYCVRKGERAIRIWVPIPPSKAKIAAWREAGADPDTKPRTHFRLGPVFDRSQVDELPPPSVLVPIDCPISNVSGDELGWCIPLLVAFAESIGSAVSFEVMPPGVGGRLNPRTRAITLNSTRPVNSQVKSGVHELGHALVRAEPGDDDPKLTYAEEELVVESIAYTVCGSLGSTSRATRSPTSRAGLKTPGWRPCRRARR